MSVAAAVTPDQLPDFSDDVERLLDDGDLTPPLRNLLLDLDEAINAAVAKAETPSEPRAGRSA